MKYGEWICNDDNLINFWINFENYFFELWPFVILDVFILSAKYLENC